MVLYRSAHVWNQQHWLRRGWLTFSDQMVSLCIIHIHYINMSFNVPWIVIDDTHYFTQEWYYINMSLSLVILLIQAKFTDQFFSMPLACEINRTHHYSSTYVRFMLWTLANRTFTDQCYSIPTVTKSIECVVIIVDTVLEYCWQRILQKWEHLHVFLMH